MPKTQNPEPQVGQLWEDKDWRCADRRVRLTHALRGRFEAETTSHPHMPSRVGTTVTLAKSTLTRRWRYVPEAKP